MEKIIDRELEKLADEISRIARNSDEFHAPISVYAFLLPLKQQVYQQAVNDIVQHMEKFHSDAESIKQEFGA